MYTNIVLLTRQVGKNEIWILEIVEKQQQQQKLYVESSSSGVKNIFSVFLEKQNLVVSFTVCCSIDWMEGLCFMKFVELFTTNNRISIEVQIN